MTLKVAGTNTSVHGAASEVPASSLQPVQPVFASVTDRLNMTVRVQGAGVVPFTASLQRELVSALLHVRKPALLYTHTLQVHVSATLKAHSKRLCFWYLKNLQL